MPEININLDQIEFEQTDAPNDPAARLRATVRIGGIPHHLEAIAGDDAMPTQQQLYETARRHMADLNRAVMDMIHDPDNPMTNADLAALVERRPEVYAHLRGLIGKLAQ